ncbi:substrate-binding periplasmic protein [Rheinheimera texasensis]|uniref:substrate-binding periplasmic protein n=1 Tax=Rheinheimera texasensis TaxID=306205 RepID=UPI0006913B27|nr:transporter substrate-binding domain-containing protein [Rheinheimera texasensis]
MMLGLTLGKPAVAAQPLRVVLEVSPPHQTLDNGKVGGLTTAVVAELLQQAGLSASFEVYPWARAFKIAATTPDVLIYNMARTPEREAQFEWIGIVTRYKFGLLKLSQREDIQVSQLADIKHYVVGAQREDFSAEWLKDAAKQPPEKLELQPDVIETWRLLVNGKLDLMIDDPQAIDDMLHQHQLERSDIEFVLFPPELEQQTWIALKKGSSPELVQRLRRAYQQVRGGSAYQQAMGQIVSKAH